MLQCSIATCMPHRCLFVFPGMVQCLLFHGALFYGTFITSIFCFVCLFPNVLFPNQLKFPSQLVFCSLHPNGFTTPPFFLLSSIVLLPITAMSNLSSGAVAAMVTCCAVATSVLAGDLCLLARSSQCTAQKWEPQTYQRAN
jgi:hypothetical protein